MNDKLQRYDIRVYGDDLFESEESEDGYYMLSENVDAVIAEKNKEIAELKAERRWRKCSEGLPLAKQRVLFLAKYKTDKVREWIGTFCHIDSMKVDFAVFYASAPGWGCEFLIDEVIGWMPLPSAPKEVKCRG